ncbi:MAG: hypothetical protein ABSA65_19050 [Acidimicrobiales bacterium]
MRVTQAVMTRELRQPLPRFPAPGRFASPATGTSGLSRERALAILGQLVGALRELRRLRHQANNREQA